MEELRENVVETVEEIGSEAVENIAEEAVESELVKDVAEDICEAAAEKLSPWAIVILVLACLGGAGLFVGIGFGTFFLVKFIKRKINAKKASQARDNFKAVDNDFDDSDVEESEEK